jgi:hypothetical protein
MGGRDRGENFLVSIRAKPLGDCTVAGERSRVSNNKNLPVLPSSL